MCTCIEEYCLEESLENELKETLLFPHVHQFQRVYDKQLDHGEKKQVAFLNSGENKANTSKSFPTFAKFKTDLKKPTEGTDDDQSVSIDLEEHLSVHPDETVRFL